MGGKACTGGNSGDVVVTLCSQISKEFLLALLRVICEVETRSSRSLVSRTQTAMISSRWPYEYWYHTVRRMDLTRIRAARVVSAIVGRSRKIPTFESHRVLQRV